MDRTIAVAAFLGIGLWPITGHTLSFDSELEYQARYSTNIARVEDNPQADVTHVGIARLGVVQNTSRFSTRGSGVFSYLYYNDETLSNEALFYGDISSQAILIPRRLNWMVQDRARQVRVDPLQTLGTGNRQNQNDFWTGPDLFFRPGVGNEVILGGRYGNITYSDTNNDNQRGVGTLQLARQVSMPNRVSLNGQVMAVDYSDDIYQDYDKYDEFLRFERRTTITSLSLDAGASQIERETQTLNSGLYRLILERRGVGGVALRLAAISELADTGSDALVPSSSVVSPEFAVSDVFERNRVDLSIAKTIPDQSWMADIYYEERNYDTAPLDNSAVGVILGYSKQLTAYVSGSMAGSLEERTYDGSDVVERLGGASARLTRIINPKISVFAGTIYASSDSSGGGRQYKETQYLLGLTYRPWPRSLSEFPVEGFRAGGVLGGGYY